MRNDRTIRNNKEDIIISDNEIGIYMLIDVAIPGDRNVIKKEAENILNCKDFLTFRRLTSTIVDVPHR